MRDRLPLCEHSFLLHVFGEVFHEIFFAKGVQHIIAWYDVSRQYSRLLQTGIDIPGTHLQFAREIAHTVGDEVDNVIVHAVLLCPFTCKSTAFPLIVGQAGWKMWWGGDDGWWRFCGKEAERRIKIAEALIEPAIMIFMGLMVGSVVLSIVLPMLDAMTIYV